MLVFTYFFYYSEDLTSDINSRPFGSCLMYCTTIQQANQDTTLKPNAQFIFTKMIELCINVLTDGTLHTVLTNFIGTLQKKKKT